MFAKGAGVTENAHAGQAGKQLSKQSEALAYQLWAEEGRSGDISPWPRQARDQPAAHRITHRRRDDRDRVGRLPGSQTARCRTGDDEVDLERYQLSRKFGKPLDSAIRRPVLEHDIPALDVTQIVEALAKGVEAGPPLGVNAVDRQQANALGRAGLLCRGGMRSGQGDGAECREGASLHEVLVRPPRDAP
jgi:hypothetical protein